MTDKSDDKYAGAREQAMAQYRHIVHLTTCLRAAEGDDDAFAEIAQAVAEEAGFTLSQDAEGGFAWVAPKSADADEARFETAEEAWLACCEDNGLRPVSDSVRQSIEENALSVEVRSGWVSPGSTEMKAEEFNILLCTGGPAVRIRGELDQYGEPDRAWLEMQDWFVPWSQVFDIEQDTLLDYCRVFYFGEG